MRLIAIGVAAVAVLAGCANLGAPPGGPPDAAPPLILSIRPDSGEVVPSLKDDLVIQFDEVIEEVPGMAASVHVDEPFFGRSLGERPKETDRPLRVRKRDANRKVECHSGVGHR